MSFTTDTEIVLRMATPEDSQACGAICYKAFSTLNTAHGFPCDFPHAEAAVGMLSTLFASPHFHCVVAEVGGRVVGSNCLDERSAISGVGPITVDPEVQNAGVGRRLMRAVMERAEAQGAPGVRLVQAAFHNRSLSLYTLLGFDPREPLSCVQGRTRDRSVPGCTVRAAQHRDVEACNAVSQRVHGFERRQELTEGIDQGTALVVEHEGRVTGYASHLSFFGHAVAETTRDMQALIASADSFAGPGILVPTRNHELLRWCLANGLRVVQPMTLMSMGFYQEPMGAWLPSVTF